MPKPSDAERLGLAPQKTDLPPADVAAPPDADPLVVPSDEPITLADVPLHALTHEEFLEQIGFINSAPAPKPYEPPPLTERQQSQREIEMEAGRRRVAFNEAQKRAQLPPPPDKSEGATVPVMRPGDGAGTREQNPRSMR